MSRFRPSRNYVSGKVVFDGGPVDISGDLVVSGSITANEYNVNVINTNVTHIDADGNTKFGDTPDDTHQFTGSVFINGPLSASSIIGGGSTTPGAPDTSVQFNDAGAFAGDPDFTWDSAANALTVNGDITASVNISGAFFHGDGSGLTGVTATASPAGSNTEIQYNADGALGADADFTWASGSNVLNVNGSITSSAITISSSNPAETLLRVDSYEAPYLLTVDASSSFDGASRLMMRNSNDNISEPNSITGRGLIHLEQLSTSSAALEGNGISIWTDTNGDYSSALRLYTFQPPAGAGSEIQFLTSNGTIASPGVVDNQALGRLSFGGWDGNGQYYGALIYARATENWDFGTKNGTDLQFYTVPTGKGTTNLKERVRFTGEGHLIVFPYSASNNDTLNIETNYDKSAGAPTLQVYGPTLFGSSSINTHTFTGSVNVSGTVAITGSTSQLQTPEIQFDIDHLATGHSTGRFYWDDEAKTITADMQGSDVRLQIGQEQHIYVKNSSTGSIPNGAAVRIVGAVGTNIQVDLAISEIRPFTEETEQDAILGLATEEILFNQSGYITTFGQVRDVDTSAFSTGDILYLSNTVSGSWTNVKPPAPYFDARIGVVEVVNATTGVILSRPAEPLFLTDIASITASNVPAGVPSYLCYDDTTSIANFTNELSGAFSGSYQGDGSNLTNVSAPLLVGKSLFVDSVNGDDGTGTRGDESLPYSTVGAAITDSLSGDAIYVGPGEYPESGLSLPTGRALIGSAGYTRTSLGITSSATDILATVDDTWVEGLTFNVPTGSGNAGIRYTGTGGTMQAYSLAYAGDGASGLGDGFVKTGTGKVIGAEVRLTTGGLNSIIRVDQGVMAFESIHVPSASGVVENVALVEGTSRAQLINFNAGNPNVVNTLTMTGSATAVCLSVNWFNVQNGANLLQDGVTVEINGGLVEPSTYSVKLDTGVTWTSATSIDIVNTTILPTFLFPPSGLDTEFEAFFTQKKGDDYLGAARLLGVDFIAGFPEKGAGIMAGKGASYGENIKVYTSDGTDTPTTVGAVTDVSITASSLADSTFTFEGGAVDHCIYYGSIRKTSDGELVRNFGTLIDTTVGSLTGAYAFEIWDGSAWSDIDYMCTSLEEGYRYANNPFMRSSSKEFVRLGVNGATWATSSVDGIDAYWSRCRITTSASLPTFERWWLTPSHFMVSSDGVRQSHGAAAWKQTLVGAGNIFGESGGVVTADISVGSGVAPNAWTHNMPNSLLNQNDDAIYTQFALPSGINTSFPLTFKVLYSLDNNTGVTTFPTGILSAIPFAVTGVEVADPAGGKLPAARQFSNTETLTSKAAPLAQSLSLQPEGAVATDDLSNRLFSIEYTSLSIEEYYEDDIIAIRFELDDDGTPNYNVAIWAIIVEGHKFTEGKAI